jgi:thioredoxin 1
MEFPMKNLLFIIVLVLSSPALAKDFGKVFKAESDKQLQEWVDKAQANNTPVILDFTMEGCHYCEQMAPVVKELAAENKAVLFIEVDQDLAPETVRKFRVTGFPTFVGPGGKIVGATSKERLRGLIQAKPKRGLLPKIFSIPR